MNSEIHKWRPVTHDFGLIQAPVEEVTDALRRWHSSFGTEYTSSEISSDLNGAFSSLLPLSNSRMRRLFVGTKSDWTGCFQNGIQGSDPFPAMSFLAQKCGCFAMRVCSTARDVRWPACIWEVYADASSGGGPLGYRRAIAASNDGGRWGFLNSGEPFPFERLESYKIKKVRDRFTQPMLDGYLREFGIRAFEDDFFDVSAARPAIRLQQVTNVWHAAEFTLEEVVEGKPWRE